MCGIDPDPTAMNDRGFTLLELLVASAVLVVVVAAVATLASPIHHATNRSLADGDLLARARMVLAAVVDDLQGAGNGVAVGEPPRTLHDAVSAVVLQRSLDDPTVQAPFTAVSITRVSPLAQGVLADSVTEESAMLRLDLAAPCALQHATCGFGAGNRAIVVAPLTARGVLINGADPATNTIALAAPVGFAFARGSALIGVEHVSYGLRTAADGSNRLVRLTSADAEQPVADHVVDFELAIADPVARASGVQRIDVRLRVEAVSVDLRGPAGTLFRHGGTARSPRAWVPDIELRTSVALRMR
jgi:prepilin-type N-terminal cleavage/methylation domain-containing protein